MCCYPGANRSWTAVHGRGDAMLLWFFSGVLLLLIPLEAADEDDVKAGTEHDLIYMEFSLPPPSVAHMHSLDRLQHSG